jgi:integrase
MKVWKRKDRDVWIVDYRDPVTRKRVRMVGGATREEAERTFAERKLKDIDTPVQNRAESTVTVKEFATRWLALVQPHLAQRTHLSYTALLARYILPALGSVKLRELRRRDIAALLAEKRVTLGRNTVRLIKAVLSTMLDSALDAELVPSNVAAGRFKVQGKGRKRTKIRAMSHDQLTQCKQTITQMQQDGLLPLRMSMLLLTLAGTGLRPSEALALQRGDVDLLHTQLRIERALDLDGSPKATKTDERRDVDLSDALTTALREYVTWLDAEALAHGQPALWLFPGETGPIPMGQLRQVFVRVLRRAALPHFALYDLRHTYASLLLSANVPLLYVSDQLGHGDATTTLKFYADWMPRADDPRYVNLLDQSRHHLAPKKSEVMDSMGESGLPKLIRNQCGKFGWLDHAFACEQQFAL